MYPEVTTAAVPNQDSQTTNSIDGQFIGDARRQLSTLSGEIAERNSVIETNDAYVYGDYLRRSIRVPVGHDFTPVNWLRRVCEIHRTQTMGDGFTVSSSYHGVDVDDAFDPNAKPQLQMINEKAKDAAESRNKLFQSIMRDNDGFALFANLAENGSAVGTSVLKAWYDEDKQTYCLDMVEAVENFYSAWSSNTFRSADFHAYVWQVSKMNAIKDYDAPENVVTSPLGSPLNVQTVGGVVAQNVSTQPMVTIMEITGKVQGYRTDGFGNIEKCKVGEETELNAFIVGNAIKQVIDEKKYMPHYYVFPNKRVRRRPWGQPDISQEAIAINQTYIETISDWRTVQSKVNFPKFKGFGFGLGTQLPKPQPRTVEIIGLGEGQDIVPIQNPNSQGGADVDFLRTVDEMKQAFVRETGISRQLFDIPDSASSNSNQAAMTAMKSISDQVEARRMLWSPIIQKVFFDALECLGEWDDNIKALVEDPSDWYIRVDWPPSMRRDDPAYQVTKLNRLIAGTMSIQTFLESLGENAKEEIDRISDEMDDPITAAIHGKLLGMLAEFKIAGPPGSAPPKTTVTLRGDITPEQETNLSVMKGFGDGPVFGPTSGPQGELGIRATDDAVNTGQITGQGYSAGMPVISGPGAAGLPGAPPVAPGAGATPPGGAGSPATPTQPQLISPPGAQVPGATPMSQPNSGAPTPNSAHGNVKQKNQRSGRQ